MDWKLFSVVSVFVAISGLITWVGFGIIKARKAATERLAAYGSAEFMREETLKKSLAERVAAPIFMKLGKWFARFTPVGWMEKTQHRIVLAGSPGNLDANAWAVVKVISVTVAAMVFFLVRPGMDAQTALVAFILLGILGFFGPDVRLTRRIDERRKAMQKTLPDVLDLLVISVEAGLGFDSALARVVGTVPGPLSEEFFRMLQETRVGVSRRDAMRHLSDRTDVDELRSFLLAMMQAEAFGVSIAQVLRVQADEMRVKRRQRAQEKAFAAPVKLVFPLVFCIFPALFIVLLGPAAISIYETFTGL
ncbi:MAG: type II secretion system F family protein [Gammaproteobacteria bacterium]|nr:type II secretion system F family protein [Gammaproteobacteria bacterium]